MVGGSSVVTPLPGQLQCHGIKSHQRNETRCSSMVGPQLMVQGVTGSILYDGPTELFLIPASVLLTQAVMCVILSMDGAYKRSLAANHKQ